MPSKLRPVGLALTTDRLERSRRLDSGCTSLDARWHFDPPTGQSAPKQHQEASRLPERYTSLKPTGLLFGVKHLSNNRKRLYGKSYDSFWTFQAVSVYNDRVIHKYSTYPAVLFPAECCKNNSWIDRKIFLSEDYILQYFLHDKGFVFRYHLVNFTIELILSNTQNLCTPLSFSLKLM